MATHDRYVTASPESSRLIHALGGLVLDGGRVEAWLAIVAAMLLYSTEEERQTAMIRLAKARASDALKELLGQAQALPPELTAALESLSGKEGLLEQRNRFVHAIWRETESGFLTGMNLRNAAEAVRAGDLEARLAIGQIEDTRAALAEVADTLGNWMARRFGIEV